MDQLYPSFEYFWSYFKKAKESLGTRPAVFVGDMSESGKKDPPS